MATQLTRVWFTVRVRIRVRVRISAVHSLVEPNLLALTLTLKVIPTLTLTLSTVTNSSGSGIASKLIPKQYHISLFTVPV